MPPDLDHYLEITEYFPDTEGAFIVCLGKDLEGQFVLWSEMKATSERLIAPRKFPCERESRSAYQELVDLLTKEATSSEF